MFDLLELPPEILGRIFDSLIIDHGAKVAVKARLTCKYFDTDILRAIWTTRALEGYNRPRPTRFIGERILISYLLARTLADRGRQHYLTAAIYGALEHIQQVLPDFLIDDEAIRNACSAVVRTSKQPDPSCALEPALLEWSPAENALALASYMNLDYVVQTLIEDGVVDHKTYFGYPLHHVSRCWHPSQVSLYLDAKLKAVQNRMWPVYKGCGRDISFTQYREAMRLAIHENSPRVLNLIMDAARDDGKLDKPEHGNWLPQLNVRRHGTTSIQNFILLHAIQAERLEIAKKALDDGADPKVGVKGSTLLDIAAESGNVQMLALLLDSGADSTYCIRGSPLTTAVFFGHEEAVKFCLDYGMTNFSRISPDGTWVASVHPLVVAGRQKHLNILRLLLENGIIFELNSELDRCLSQGAYAEMKKILEEHRKNPRLPTSMPDLEAGDSTSLALRSWKAAVRASAHTMQPSTTAVRVPASVPRVPTTAFEISAPNTQVSIPPPQVLTPAFDTSAPVPQPSISLPQVSTPVFEISVPIQQLSTSLPQVSTPTLEISAPTPQVSIPTPQMSDTSATLSQPISCPNLRDQPKPRSREGNNRRLDVPIVDQPRINKRTPPHGLRKVKSFLSQSSVLRAIRAV